VSRTVSRSWLGELADPGRIERAGEPQTVVVIGAGLAGLAAAYELTRAGHEVTVLEARLRPGGRVHTLRDSFADGLYAEAGATHIPDNHKHTLHYIGLFGLPLDPVPPIQEVYYVRGQRLAVEPGVEPAWPVELNDEERRLGWAGMLKKYLGPAVEEMGDPAALALPPAALAKYDALPLTELLCRQGATPAAVALLRLGYFDMWNDGADTVSALAMLRWFALQAPVRRLYTIRGGNDALPKAIASRLAGKIIYGAPVVALEQDPDRAFVTVVRAGERQTLAADRVICSVPFSVLGRIAVAPPFSAVKRRAVHELAYTSVTRVFLQSRRKFWVGKGAALLATTNLPIMSCLDGPVGHPGPRGILESYTVGPWARVVAALAEDERLAFTLAEMEKVFPGIRDHYEGGASYCWDNDEWARGGFAWFRPGQMSSLLPHVAAAEGRVHFAGEHTSAWSGWMEGALESGNRAAREVNAARASPERATSDGAL
jgi:monoamine oxidase